MNISIKSILVALLSISVITTNAYPYGWGIWYNDYGHPVIHEMTPQEQARFDRYMANTQDQVHRITNNAVC